MSHLLNSLNTDIFVMLTQVPFLNKPTKSCNVKRQKVIRVGPFFFFSVKDWNVIYIFHYIYLLDLIFPFMVQYVLSKAGVMEESVNRELNITRS